MNRKATPATRLTKRAADKARSRVTGILDQLPEARAVPIGAHLSLEVRKKRFGYFLCDHHGDGRLAINCKAPALVAAQLHSALPEQFHVPAYVGHRGWIGLWLDVPRVDWPQVEAALREAYALTAPRTLLRATAQPTGQRDNGTTGQKR